MSAYCTTTLNYGTGGGLQPVTVAIRNGRDGTPAWESCGFERLSHRSAVTDWRDPGHLADVHMAEVRELAQALTGCDHALAYPPLIRSPGSARRSVDFTPVEFVHSDFTDDYRAMVCDPERDYAAFIAPALETVGIHQDELADAERLLMLQFWRNTGARRPDYPLAFCDAATVPRSDLYAFLVPEYGGQKLAFETFGVLPPEPAERHHWYSFPELGDDEVVAFRTYDSRCADEGRPFWTPHSAFRDPLAGAQAPRRESLEMRVLCVFGL